MIGRQLGHYTVVEHIGSGAMGVVYRARDDTLDRDVALKILPGGALDPAARGRLQKEARALSRAAHPSIATVYDFATEGDLDFIVMELVPGETLAQRLAAGPLSDAEVLDLGQQLALGLAAAHAAGVIHRDVKPSNLKVTPDGRLKILDFGVALQALSDTETTRTASFAGRMAGTLPYMAPEQLRGADADVRSDVYGAGAVLYEMATGTRAFPERQEGPLFDAVLRRPVAPPRTIRPSLSPQIEACILKALEKDPDLRYQSARDLGRDLGAATASIPAITPRVTSSRWRLRLIQIAAALVIVALGGFAVRPYLGRLAGATRPESPASSPTAPAATAPVTAPLLLAVVPPQNLTSRPAVDAWLPLVQSLFTAELTGVRDLGVIDPLTLNLRVTARRGRDAPQQRLHEALDDLGVGLTIDSRILPAGTGFQLQSNLVDRRSSEVRFTNRADLYRRVGPPSRRENGDAGDRQLFRSPRVEAGRHARDAAVDRAPRAQHRSGEGLRAGQSVHVSVSARRRRTAAAARGRARSLLRRAATMVDRDCRARRMRKRGSCTRSSSSSRPRRARSIRR